MKMMVLTLILACCIPRESLGQESLLESLMESETDNVENFGSTFKSTRIINAHSVELRQEGVLDVLIMHRFGRINSGAYNFFGLDQANMRIGLEYGISDRLNVGIGRSSFQKVFDGYLKYTVLEQKSHTQRMPLSLVLFSNMTINSLRLPEFQEDFEKRLSYTFQSLIARRFNKNLSLQVTPTFVRRNHVSGINPQQDLFALGFGGRYLVTRRVSFNLEYFHHLNAPENALSHHPIAVGFDIETGGHVFQLHFTNAQAMIETGFIPETTGNFFKGDIHFGFNISRTFQVK